MKPLSDAVKKDMLAAGFALITCLSLAKCNNNTEDEPEETLRKLLGEKQGNIEAIFQTKINTNDTRTTPGRYEIPVGDVCKRYAGSQ